MKEAFVIVALWAIAVCLVAAEDVSEEQLVNEGEAHDEKFDSRIINGKFAALGQFPWQAYIQQYLTFTTYFGCGGALIHPQWVLTAAHCTEGPAFYYKVYLGSIIRGEGEIVFDVVTYNVFRHEGYGKPPEVNIGDNNDIALIKLPTPVVQSANVKAIKLVPDSYSYFNVLQISGFGTLDDTNNASPVLKYVNVRQQSFAECSRFYPNLTSNVMCTVGTASGITQSACHGDSGGPVIIPQGPASPEWPVLVAIVSFSFKPCTLGYPEGQTRVKPYKQWIKNRIPDLVL